MQKLSFIYILMFFIFSPLILWAQTEEPETEVPGIVDAKAITLFGVSFDLTTTAAKSILKNRFKCMDWTMENKSKCRPEGGGTIITWGVNTLGDLNQITFDCVIFSGCTYTPMEVYLTLDERFELVGPKRITGDNICADGALGEVLCVSKRTGDQNQISLYKNKFRQKAMNFD